MVINFKRTFIFSLLILLSACGKDDGFGIGDTESKGVYITAQTYSGNLGGAAGADAKCMTDSLYPGSGVYKALLVDSTRHACTTANCSGGLSENKDWVFRPERDYYRQYDKVTIGKTNANGVFTFPLEHGLYTGHPFWSGLTATWTVGNTCSNWTSGAAVAGDRGDATTATVGSTSISNAGTCNTLTRLICVQQ